MNLEVSQHGKDIVRSITRSTSVSIIALGMVLVPQVVLRSASYSEKVTAIFIALVSAFLTLVGSLFIAGLLHRHVPQKASHQLAEWYVGHWAGLLLSAARILAYALILILGVGLAVNSAEALLDISWDWALESVLILLVAVPALAGRMRRIERWGVFFAAGAVLGMVVLLGYGLILEATGSIDFENIRLAQENSFTSDRVVGQLNYYVESVLAGAMVGAISSLISERILKDSAERRVSRRRLGAFMLAAFLIIAIVFYFIVALHMPGHREALPTLTMSYSFFGPVGQVVYVVLFALLGLAVAITAYAQLPRLLRELALDGLLPRKLAAADAVAPRRAIVALIAALAATVTLALDSARSIAAVFVFIVYIIIAFVSAAMVSRSRTILTDSTVGEERRVARGLAWVFAFYGLAALGVAGLVVYAQPMWALAGVVALSVPVLFLVAYSRGQSKVREQLKLGDVSEGRHLPTRVHGVVIIDRVDAATISAVTWARAMRLSSLTAVCVDIDPRQTRRIREAWEASLVPVDLTILGEPKGAWRGPVVDYIRSQLAQSPHDIVNVIIPRVIYSSAWERFFLRHSTPRVISDLRFEPRVMITEAPYRLGEGD
ncbi:hypothetical protein HMPREF3167_01475 [Trueperella sp. HMSC08B05]|uniref:APC family permease n=1 Tax=Trueperella bernardiae TaxID=59561 RepID=A0AAW6ZNQ7_9ACTO|nr:MULTISPECIES: APC family permease [Trueperella]MDK8602603.1 APC family permease [Trueperella bernardiae]OCW60995.1 hypothetical protein AKG36_00725 [Trueperella bernardiae]OFS75977.1 hypothetical protein HMPREF3167_01475 [Trueperella sp. HMSC08B05]PKZ89907.1 APC family permease [Trueperella bernardiae]